MRNQKSTYELKRSPCSDWPFKKTVRGAVLACGLICALTLACMKQPTSESDTPADESQNQEMLMPIIYAGSETLEEVELSIRQFEQQAGCDYFTAVEETEIVASFKAHRSSPSTSLAAAYRAYTSHFVYHPPTDVDLWLEYKWGANQCRPYYMYTSTWLLTKIVQKCYNGQITSWTWYEGGYQRVTAIIGYCGWVPYGRWPTFSDLWVVVG